MKKKWLAVTVVGVFILAMASVGSAHWPNGSKGGGQGAGWGYNCPNTALSPEVEKKVEEIEAKYKEELESKEKAYQAKEEEFEKALKNDDTTLGALNALKDGLRDSRQEYFSVRNKMNKEIGAELGTGYSGCNKRGRGYRNGPGDCNQIDCCQKKGSAGYGNRGQGGGGRYWCDKR